MAHWPQHQSPWLEEVPQAFAMDYMQSRRNAIAETVQRVPPHDEFLRRYLG
jgi:tryptophan halogenase